MASYKRRYSKEEFARRGDALVESKVCPNLTAADEELRRAWLARPAMIVGIVTIKRLHRR